MVNVQRAVTLTELQHRSDRRFNTLDLSQDQALRHATNCIVTCFMYNGEDHEHSCKRLILPRPPLRCSAVFISWSSKRHLAIDLNAQARVGSPLTPVHVRARQAAKQARAIGTAAAVSVGVAWA